MPEMGKWIYLQRSYFKKRAMVRVQVIMSPFNIRTLLFKSCGFRGTILSNKEMLLGVPARPGAIHTVFYHAKMDIAVMGPAWQQLAHWCTRPGTDSLLFFITCLISMIPWCNVLTWRNTAPAHKSHSEKAPWCQSMWQDHWGAAVRQGISCLAAQAVFALWGVDFLRIRLVSFTFTISSRNTYLEHKWYYNTIIYI